MEPSADNMNVQSLLARVHEFGDIELAILLCLMSGQHGLIQVDPTLLHELEQELMLTAKSSFGLTSKCVRFSTDTTLDELATKLLIEKSSLVDSLDYSGNDGLCIPNLVIMRDLQNANHQVQIQVLELLRSKRIFTHTSLQSAPKNFVVIVVNEIKARPLVNHLRDYIFLSHVHDAEDEFSYLRGDHDAVTHQTPIIDFEDINILAEAANSVVSTVEITRYINDVVIFLRMHRAVAGGTTPLATKYLLKMTNCLAAIHGLNYVTPALVALATRKVFRHRLVIVQPENERSLQYGSDLAAVAAVLENVTAESTIDEVLDTVQCPL